MRSFLSKAASYAIALALITWWISDVNARRPPSSRPITSIEKTIRTPPPLVIEPATIPLPHANDAFKALQDEAKRISDPLQLSHYRFGSKEKDAWRHTTNALGQPTTSPEKAYVALRIGIDGEIIATTNFLQAGFRDAPTIRLTSEDLLVGDRFTTAITKLLGKRNVAEQAMLKLVVDADISTLALNPIFDTYHQTFKFNTGEFRHAELFLKNNDRVFGLDRIDRPNPPPRWAAKLNQCCVFTGVPPDLVNWAKLGTIRFDPQRAQVLSLFSDSLTSKLLKQRNKAQDITNPRDLAGDTVTAVSRLVRSQPPGTPLILVGHAQEGVFRIEGTNPIDISFDFITREARDAKRPLILLGCYTSEHFSSSRATAFNDFAGTLNKLHPQEIAPKIIKAMETSSNYKELSERLSSEDLYLWISPKDFMRDAHEGTARVLRAPIFKVMANGIHSIVGFVFMYLPCGSGTGCGT